MRRLPFRRGNLFTATTGAAASQRLIPVKPLDLKLGLAVGVVPPGCSFGAHSYWRAFLEVGPSQRVSDHRALTNARGCGAFTRHGQLVVKSIGRQRSEPPAYAVAAPEC